MPHLALDALADPDDWQVTASGGGAPELALAATLGPAAEPGIVLVLGTGASGDEAEVQFPRTDVRELDELQLWLRSDTVMDTRAGFLVEMRLGATNLNIATAANQWFRYLPAAATGTWALVTVGIDDAHERIRQNLNRIRFTALGDGPATIELAGLAAIRRNPFDDVETALVELLGGQVDLGGPVPAVVAPDVPPGGGTHLRIRPVAVRPTVDAMRSGEVRTDYTDRGYRVRPAPSPMDIEYAIDVVADNRDDQRTLSDFLIRRLPEQGTFAVAGRPTSMSWSGPLATAGDPPVPSAQIRVTVPRPTDTAPQPVVRPYERIQLEVDHGA